MTTPYAEWTEERKQRSRDAAASWKDRHPGQSAARASEWSRAHPERHNETQKRYADRLAPEVRLARRREQWLKRNYGLTRAEFDAMREAQGDRCAACRGEWTDGKPHVDHDHATGKVRGLLCVTCNITAGFLESENRHVVQAYLDRMRG